MVDICIKAVIFILIGNDLLLEYVLLVLELTCIFFEVIYFALDVVVVESEFLGVAGQQFVVFADSCGSLFESESLVE